MKPLNFVQSEKWKEQVLAGDLAWHEGLGHFRSDTEREAFKAGFQAGWSGLRKTLLLHKIVVTDGK